MHLFLDRLTNTHTGSQPAQLPPHPGFPPGAGVPPVRSGWGPAARRSQGEWGLQGMGDQGGHFGWKIRVQRLIGSHPGSTAGAPESVHRVPASQGPWWGHGHVPAPGQHYDRRTVGRPHPGAQRAWWARPPPALARSPSGPGRPLPWGLWVWEAGRPRTYPAQASLRPQQYRR